MAKSHLWGSYSEDHQASQFGAYEKSIGLPLVFPRGESINVKSCSLSWKADKDRQNHPNRWTLDRNVKKDAITLPVMVHLALRISGCLTCYPWFFTWSVVIRGWLRLWPWSREMWIKPDNQPLKDQSIELRDLTDENSWACGCLCVYGCLCVWVLIYHWVVWPFSQPYVLV